MGYLPNPWDITGVEHSVHGRHVNDRVDYSNAGATFTAQRSGNGPQIRQQAKSHLKIPEKDTVRINLLRLLSHP